MIDFHTHILPGIDDGSRNVEESIEIINELKKIGVDIICLTPHFYASKTSIDTFLRSREEAFTKLVSSVVGVDFIKGAEVYYYPGISLNKDIERLSLGNNGVILLEMPFNTWNETVINEVINLSKKVILVLAHIERYLGYNKMNVIERLITNGCYVQCNYEFFDGLFKFKKACELFERGYINFFGSDSHRVDDAKKSVKIYTKLVKKYGKETLESFDDKGREMLGVDYD